ncbi:MAG: cupin domain-containing protein [Candidatus Bipolaricaulaceae bacterium]
MAVVRKMEEIEAQDISNGKDVVGVRKRVLIGPREGAPTFAVRLFSLAPGGHTPAHSHPYEHGVIVLRGRGEVLGPEGPKPIEPGVVVFVPPHEFHGFRNTGKETLEFLCVVPVSVEK